MQILLVKNLASLENQGRNLFIWSPVMRCLSLLVLLFPVHLSAVSGQSWVGRKVCTKDDTIKIWSENKKKNELPNGVLFLVERDENGWLRVNDGGVIGWIKKKESVLLKNAIEYFTRRIKANLKDSSAYSRRGVAFALKGQLDRALMDFDQMIRLLPNRDVAALYRANAQGRNQRMPQQVAAIDVPTDWRRREGGFRH